MLVNDTAAAIQRGEVDVVLLGGAEAIYTRVVARKTKARDTRLDWTAGCTTARRSAPHRPATRLGITTRRWRGAS